MADKRIEDLRRRKAELYLGGGAKRIDKQHASGKRTARERLGQLYDQDNFQEAHPFMSHRCVDFGMQDRKLPGEGVVTGYGLVDGRPGHSWHPDSVWRSGADSVGGEAAQTAGRSMAGVRAAG